MKVKIEDIQTPVHVLIELEFSFFNLLLLDQNKQTIGTFQFPVTNKNYNHAFKALDTLDILSAQSFVWPSASTLVPEQFFDLTKRELYLNNLYPDTSIFLIKSQPLTYMSAQHVYGIETMQQLALLSIFTGITINSTLPNWIKGALDVNPHKKALHIHQLPNQIWILLIDNQNVIRCNHYPIETIEDTLYFISANHQNDFEKNTPIVFSGNSTRELTVQLSAYFTTIEQASYPILNNPILHAHH